MYHMMHELDFDIMTILYAIKDTKTKTKYLFSFFLPAYFDEETVQYYEVAIISLNMWL